MPFVPKAIHQFHGGSGVGDAITAGLFHTRGLLRGMGFASEIYCIDVAAELVGEIHGAPTFVDDPDILLLVHFSWAIAYDQWLQRLSCRKALVYHNITPEEFFEDGWFNATAQKSRRQLADLRPSMQAALAQSEYSARELEDLGYAPVDVLPLLFDPADWRRAPHDAAHLDALRSDDAYKILFVGRIVTNKAQEDLLRVVDRLRRMMRRPVKLILVGGLGAGAAYRDRLLEVRKALGLEDCVEIAGKIDDGRLRALYRGCDVFLSLSEHEGFCVPVIEAMQFDLPVVAYAASAVPETVGEGGLLLADKDPGRVAALLKVLSEEPEMRRRLVQAGRRNVQRFARQRTILGLARFLEERLGVAVSDVIPSEARDLSGNRKGPSLRLRSGRAPSARDDKGGWRLEGPFDSSYSLALVNRSLARALSDQQVDVGLHSTEGDGDFPPDHAFLSRAPDVAALWHHGREMDQLEVVLRNLYPPRVSGMEAPTRLLSNWGWEESGLPAPWPARFNRSLNLITTVSRFVAKVLVDNGVKVPVAVVGNGCEHFQDITPVAMNVELGRGFRFLHVSSGFPRKGIDVLLAAWGRAFTGADDVALAIKTFPNPHNRVKEQVEALRREVPGAAEIVILDHDVGAGEMAWLYRNCQALVAPSRGEGFGLPVAEAMLQGLPAIVTGHGGMREFCSDQTAWLVDYRFADADTHFELFGSAWTEPDVDDLVRALREVRGASADERARRAGAARQTIQALFTWPAAARRTRQAVAELDRHPAPAPLPRVAWVTSWNVRCGIASYARHLACRFPTGSLLVMASHAAPSATSPGGELLQADEPYVQRCWKQGWDDDLEALGRAIAGSGARHAVFQFNFGFFEIKAFGGLLDRLRDRGIDCHVVMHSTQDVDRPEIKISLREIGDSLARARRLIVHGIADLNRLKGFGLVDNVTLMPHGVALTVPADLARLRRDRGLTGKRVIATFGYLLPNKGVRPLIEAFAELHARQPDLHLLLLTSLYPVPDSEQELERCRETIDRLGLGDRVGLGDSITLITDYLGDEAAQALLQTAELIVYAYQHSQESASGAVRFGLASGRPVACTPLPIFDDVGRVVHTLPGIEAADLARGIGELLGDGERLERLAKRQAALLAATNWPALSERLWNMLRAPAILDLVEEDRRQLTLSSRA